MSKILCEVCGTAYPETVEQCPICGCVRPADVSAVISDSEGSEGKSGYTHVKGGRFSKANVKKRARSPIASGHNEAARYDENIYDNKEPADPRKGLIATALLFLLAIVAVVIYITVRFMGVSDNGLVLDQSGVPDSQTQSAVHCTGLEVDDLTISLANSGDAWMLSVTKQPIDTSEELTCVIADENIASADVIASDKIKITAISSGTTTMQVICGDQMITCQINCDFESSPNDQVDQTTSNDEEEYTSKDIIFNSRYNPPEATLRSEGETWNCYKGNIPVDEITWKSDDESVATVKDGIVTAVGNGKTQIHAIWGIYDLTCTVRCTFITTATGIPGSDDVGEG